jgi:hypothetical protein
MYPFPDAGRASRVRELFPLCPLVLFLLLVAGGTQARAEYFTIESFRADIAVHQDSSLTVTETIETIFTRRRHGIYRDIPFRYTDEFGKKTTAPIRVVSVTDQSRRKRPYRVTRTGDAVRIRIGRKGAFVDGRQFYVITYKVNNALLFLDNHDELYWNVTGNDWDTTIRYASAKVTVDGKQDEVHPRGSCYTGLRGSRKSSCDFLPIARGGQFRTSHSLSPREGITIALGWDKGVVRPPSSLEKIVWGLNLAENGIFLLPLATFAFMLGHWYRKGKDPDIGDTVAVLYTPPEEDGHTLLPAEIGALSDEQLDPKDITASIVHLAVRGYVTIEEQKIPGLIFDRDDYMLKRIKEADDGLSSFEKRLLVKLFTGHADEVLVSDLKYSFYKVLDDLRAAVFGRLKALGYFRALPGSVKTMYRGIGIGVGIVGAIFGVIAGKFTGDFSGKVVAAFLLSGLAVVLFAPLMPVKTRKGVHALAKVKGFEEFLLRAEKDRLERMKDQNLFEKYLPYAIAYRTGGPKPSRESTRKVRAGMHPMEASARSTPYPSTSRLTARSPEWETPCTRRREAAEAGFPEEGEAQEGEGEGEAEEVGDPGGGISPPFPLMSAFRNQGLLTGSDPGDSFPSSRAFVPATGAMASCFVFDAHVANPVATVPAPMIYVAVFPAFEMPGCHFYTSQQVSPLPPDFTL